MKMDCIMPLGSLIDKLLRGEAEDWCETDFGLYVESLTQGDKKELEKVMDTVDAAIADWKRLSFISHYEDKMKNWKEGKCSVDELDDLFNEEECLRKDGMVMLTAEIMFAAISDRGFINEHHRDALEWALMKNDVQFLKKEWEDVILAQISSFRDVVVSRLGIASSKPVNDTQSAERVPKKLNEYPEVFGIDICCELTGYSRNTIYKWTRTKEIPCHRAGSNGRKLVFKHDEIVSWLTARRQETIEEFVKRKGAELASHNSSIYNNL